MCVLLVKTTVKYDLHSYILLSWIDKDHINGLHISNNWHVEETCVQEHIGTHHRMFEAGITPLLYCPKEQKEKINREIAKKSLKPSILCFFTNCIHFNFLSLNYRFAFTHYYK